MLSGPHEDTAKELARLRKENEILRAERDLLKKAAAFFAASMAFGHIDAAKKGTIRNFVCGRAVDHRIMAFVKRSPN